MIIKDLVNRKILNKKNGIYFLEKAPELNKYIEDLTAFLLRNNIKV